MTINYPEFIEKFPRLKPSPVYLFSGEESFFIDEGVRTVREKFLEGGARDFNYDSYSAADIEASRVVEAAETLPVMAGWRVVIVKGIDEWKAKEKERVTTYLNRPSPTTCLILTATKLDRREKFSSVVEKAGLVILCQPLHKQNLLNWVRQKIKNAGMGIDQDALSMLADVTGNDLWTLHHDIEKLVLYCGDRKQITLKDVAGVSSSMRSISVFEVVNAVIEKRFKDAFLFLKRAMDEGEPPVRIFYFIVREFRMMLKAKILTEAGESVEEAAKEAGVPPFKVAEFSQRLRKFSKEELQRLFERLIDVDSRLKGGALRPERVLEELFLSIHLSR